MDPLKSGLLKALGDLGMPRFTRRYPRLCDSIVKQVVEMAHVRAGSGGLSRACPCTVLEQPVRLLCQARGDKGAGGRRVTQGLSDQMRSPREQPKVADLRLYLAHVWVSTCPCAAPVTWRPGAGHLSFHALAPIWASDWLVTCLDHLHLDAPQFFGANMAEEQPEREQYISTAAQCWLQVSASTLQEFEAKMEEEQEKKQQQQEQQAQKPQQQQETQGQPQNQEGDAAEGGQPGEQMKPEVGLLAARPTKYGAGFWPVRPPCIEAMLTRQQHGLLVALKAFASLQHVTQLLSWGACLPASKSGN